MILFNASLQMIKMSAKVFSNWNSSKSKQISYLEDEINVLKEQNEELNKKVEFAKDLEKKARKRHSELGSRLQAIDKAYEDSEHWKDVCTINNYDVLCRKVINEAESFLYNEDN